MKRIRRKERKRKERKRRKRRRPSKSVDHLTPRKTARAGAISISASCSFSKIRSKRNRKAKRSMYKLSHQSLFASAMMSS